MSAAAATPLVATIVVIFAIRDGALQVLLVRRAADPGRGLWALPGGRWDGEESLDDLAARKLVEETGVADLYLEQLFTLSGLDATQPSVAVAYFALVEASAVRLREEEEEWQPAWHDVGQLPRLAFDNNRVIEQAVERVGAKLEYTNIASCPSSSPCASSRPSTRRSSGAPWTAGTSASACFRPA
jgi:8-oxo-dGTP diphosphatase